MIRLMRKHFKGIILQIFVWITILAVVSFWGAGGMGRSNRHEGEWIAKINNEEIPYQSFVNAVARQERYISQIRAQYGQVADFVLQMYGLDKDPRVMAIESLMSEALLNDSATALGINLHDAYIDYKLADPETFAQILHQIIPADIVGQNGYVNEQALVYYLQRAHISDEEFQQMIKQALERSLILSFASAASYVPAFTYRQQYMQEYAKKEFSSLTLTAAEFYEKEKSAEIGDDVLNSFYKRESKRYAIPEKRIARVWTFEPRAYNIAITDDEMQSYYNENKAAKFVKEPEKIQVRRILFATPDQEDIEVTRERAQAVRDELAKNSSTFAERAKELSADTETAKKGGLMPFFEKGTRDSAFEKAAFLIKEDGDVSQVFESRDGIELIQRVERKPAVYKDLAAVRSEIKDALEVKKFNQFFMDDMREVYDQPDLDEQDLLKLIGKRGGNPAKVTISANDTGRQAKVIMGLQENGMNCYLESGKGIAVQLMQIQPRKVPALEEIKGDVVADLRQERAKKAFERYVEKAAAMACSKPLSEVAKEMGGIVTKIGWIDPKDTKEVDELRRKKLPSTKMMQLEVVGSVTSDIEGTQGTIVRLDAIAPFNKEDFAEKRTAVMEKVDREDMHACMQGFVASLYRNATIKTNQSLLTLDEEMAI